MKALLLLPLFCIVLHTQAQQGKDYNKTRQIEQLQQLRLAVTVKIDSLQSQLQDYASTIAGVRKKIDQLTKERNNPEKQSNEQASKLSLELQATSNQADYLQKKFDARLLELDKAINLQRDLEDKIIALERESNR
jgi:septal ring factor EnvC (AmiA/AmiB activator)